MQSLEGFNEHSNTRFVYDLLRSYLGIIEHVTRPLIASGLSVHLSRQLGDLAAALRGSLPNTYNHSKDLLS